MEFSTTDISNQAFQLAVRFVNQTNRHVFVTGKAGTGKTTFLKYIREHSFKKAAIVAPTGVAAINAGGVTMHSFFQLPPGAFIPSLYSGWSGSSSFNTPYTLLKNLRINNDKRLLFQELELLIIDEVSMLRADILDEIDCILRHVRAKMHEPFGGVQLLYIGDLFQLPPVVKTDEWDMLKHYYRSPFFFDARVLKQTPPLYLELKKIYRQHEQEFISVLNNIRNNKATSEDLDLLHKYYLPGYESSEDESYITLNTHNAHADTINQRQLDKLTGDVCEFSAEITGDFNERAYPADPLLQLKTGAQIMFIKNDKGESRRYYNGKIATIARLDNDKIYIRFQDEKNEMELAKEVWKNIRYLYNKEKDVIEEEELGTFRQYPIRLAWAITIHKSQGLTFEKAIIDAGTSFAPGQVYVALSRLTSLSGLVLYSRIPPSGISTDERVLEFTRLEKEEDQLKKELQQEQSIFIARSLLQMFDWLRLLGAVQIHYESYEGKRIPDKDKCMQWTKAMIDALAKQQEVAERFTKQLSQLLENVAQDGYQYLHQRISAGSEYFLKAIDEITASIEKHINEVKIKRKAKKYVKSLQELRMLFERKKQQLKQSIQVVEGLVKGINVLDLFELIERQKKSGACAADTAGTLQVRPQKGDSHRISLQMFREGKDVAGIAQLRELTASTIVGHLASFISTGEINIQEIVPEDKIAAIYRVMEKLNMQAPAIAAVKEKLGGDFLYSEIKAVFSYAEWKMTHELKQERS